MCANEKGWGLVVGECSEGMSGKAGIPQGSFRGLCGNKMSPTMHFWAIVTETPPSMVAMEIKGRTEKEPSLTSRKSGSIRGYVMRSRPGRPRNHKESCLERVRYLLVGCLSGVSRGRQLFITRLKGMFTDGSVLILTL